MSFDNRRTLFRVSFKLAQALHVELCPYGVVTDTAPLVGQAVDLSIGGMAVQLPEEIDAAYEDRLWAVSVSLPGDGAEPTTLVLPCTIAYRRRHRDGYRYGLNFHGLEQSQQTAQRKILWHFLVGEQRRSLEAVRQALFAGGPPA